MKEKMKIAEDFKLFENGNKQLEGVKVLLIYPPVRLSQQPLYPPFGLLSIASVLEKAGAIVDILDLNLERLTFSELKEALRQREFDIMGTGGMATVYYYMKLLAEYFKMEYPDVPVIAGGTACSGSGKVVMENAEFDVAVMGEGEPVIIDVIKGLLNKGDLSHIPGIIYKDDEGIIHETENRSRMQNLEELPFPAYHLIEMEKYIANSNIYKNKKNKVAQARVKALNLDPVKASRPVLIFSKRGCPFGCNFCYRNFGRKVVGMSVQHTLDHMAFLEEKYNTINFVFGDEIFNVDRNWVIEFCNALIKEKRNYILSVGNGLRANVVDKEMMEKMKEAGFCSVAVGIESFYGPTLKAMKKGQTTEVIADAIRDIKQTGFHLSSAQFLFGYPTDGPESMKVNVKMSKELGLKSAQFAIPCPYPGTFLYEKAIEGGYLSDEEGWLMELADRDISDRVINMSGRPEEELRRLINCAEDEIKMFFIRKEYPFIGTLLTVLQKGGRMIGFDAFSLLKGIKDGIKNLVIHRRLPDHWLQSGGANDIHIRYEAFELLEQWKNKKQLNKTHKTVKIAV
jgi:magnesium-protoporphyrin IX monomethyl ester (oxidative) cyclase